MRVTLASTPEDRFLAEIETLQATIGELPDATVRQVLASLAQLRASTLAEIAGASGFDTVRLRQLETRLTDLGQRFVERYGAAVAGPQAALFTAGQNLAAAPLVNAGVLLHVPQISTNLLEVVRAFQARLISNATTETLGAISSTLRLGALRGDSVVDVLTAIAGTLQDPGPFASLEARAEAITRTELGRIQSIATAAGLQEAKTFVPDLQKQWVHSRNAGKWVRRGHLEADGQVRDVDGTFRVRPVKGEPYEELQYPRAANASPRNSVHCGCQSVPYRAAWSAAIEAARTEQAAVEASRRRAA